MQKKIISIFSRIPSIFLEGLTPDRDCILDRSNYGWFMRSQRCGLSKIQSLSGVSVFGVGMRGFMGSILGLRLVLIAVSLNTTISAYAQSTERIPQFTNEQVKVWKTIIYPSKKQELAMHRHDYRRVVVALSDGVLKVTNNQGKTHYWKLEKNKAYYLPKDPLHELHTDENISKHPIQVMVIELK